MFDKQSDWVKKWQENQERMVKQYADWGHEWMVNVLAGTPKEPTARFFDDWLTSGGGIQGWFTESGRRLNEIINNAWKDYTAPAEATQYVGNAFFLEFYKNWLSAMKLSEDFVPVTEVDEHLEQAADYLRSLQEKGNSYLSSLSTSMAEQMNRAFGVMQGAWAQQQNFVADIAKDYQDFFTQIIESAAAQNTERLAETFDAWAKEIEKNLSAPKLGLARELAHDISQLLVLSQDFIRAYIKFSQLVEATGRKAGYRFQKRLRELSLQNKPVHQLMDFCALWSVESETVFTEVMGGEEFARLQGDFFDAGNRLKIQWNKLAEKALEPTPFALKRDLDLAIAEITQLRRDMKALQRELRENQKEMAALKASESTIEEEVKKTKTALKSAKAAVKAGTGKTKTAGTAVKGRAKRMETAGARQRQDNPKRH